ncbi:MAG: nuclear transport factor 2 family protein [Rhodocyclales bacterium]|nr:nuclear transport factor 2 family protein [Rhodocyclales bacterium]
MILRDWVAALFAAIDRQDAEAFAGFLAEDARFAFGNLPAVAGRAAVRDFVAGFFSSIRAVSHRVPDAWQTDDTVVCRGEVTYTRHDGSTLSVPFANVLTMSGDKVRDYRIYMDASALYPAG